MQSTIKKSILLNKDSRVYQDLSLASAKIIVNQGLLNKLKKDLITAVNERNELLRNELLEERNYILHSKDKVLFFEQTGEIRVIEEYGTWNDAE